MKQTRANVQRGINNKKLFNPNYNYSWAQMAPLDKPILQYIVNYMIHRYFFKRMTMRFQNTVGPRIVTIYVYNNTLLLLNLNTSS